MDFTSNPVKKIAIFRALQLGDLLCSIPALRTIRHAFPDAEITLISLPWAKSLLTRFPNYFDSFIAFPGYPGLPEQPFDAKRFAGFLEDVVARRFDLVIQMQGNGNLVNPLIETFGGREMAGFYTENVYVPAGRFIEYPNALHEIDRHLLLTDSLGLQNKGRELEFPLLEQDYKDLELSGLDLRAGQYVCIHPGSREAARQWAPGNFAKLADLAAENGLTPVITGTSDELEIAESVASLTHCSPLIAAGKTSLGAVALLIQNAHSLVSNCTGVAHIAAALKTPSIVVSLNPEPCRWAPLNHALHTTVEWLYNPDFDFVLRKSQELFQLSRAANEHVVNSAEI